MTDYDEVPSAEAVEYLVGCVNSQLGTDIANLIQRQGVTSTDAICATLTQLINFYLDTSTQTTEQIKAKATLLFYFTMSTLDRSRMMQDAMKEREHATAH
ncbi:hypothetical protein [Bradyrhizobium sp. 150]|uniref:hypothetical protein n=1 Tax=Bradyrhizobium sp. 150 TaxID=2782625 RepID=UPI001FF9968C|nr:hypothetical protein [Bradyrhizobium sp. 150]MCK1671054.1 hypothetical protein [Bradyrhizobium sp. 150]